MARRWLLAAVLLGAGAGLSSCSSGGDSNDAGKVDSGNPVADSGAPDAGQGQNDSGPADAGPADAGPADAGPLDAGPLDAGPADSGPADAGPLDAGPADAGPADAGPADAGPLDAGPLDAGSTGAVTGLVLDYLKCGAPLPGATVTLQPDGLVATTDALGAFTFTGVAANPRAVVDVVADPTFAAFTTTHAIPVAVRTGETSTATFLLTEGCLALQSFDVSGNYDMDDQSNCISGVFVPQFATVHVDPGGLVSEDGGGGFPAAYMLFAPLGPNAMPDGGSDESSLAALPGDLTGVLGDGGLTLLQSYGELELRAYDDINQLPVVLAPGFDATVMLALAAPPDPSAQMWRLDPASGRWVDPQPGSFDDDAGLYTGAVSQLGWVLVASPLVAPACIRGVATDGANALPGTEVRIVGEDNASSTVTTADGTGAFCAPAPAGAGEALHAQSASAAARLTLTTATGAAGGDCGSNLAGCVDVGQLTLPAFGPSCNTGLAAQQSGGAPITDPLNAQVHVSVVDDFWRVVCSAYLPTATVTPDATGAFCLPLAPFADAVSLNTHTASCGGTEFGNVTPIASSVDACGGSCGDLGTVDFFCGS